MKKVISVLLALTLVSSTACSGKAFNAINPFSESGPQRGERSNKAILNGGNNSQESQARNALEVMNTYRRAQAPQPYMPVIQPTEVRLMWVPDHLNKAGDLVPAHYYYLKVLNGRWNVQDSFDLEQQLEGPNSRSSRTPFVVKGSR